MALPPTGSCASSPPDEARQEEVRQPSARVDDGHHQHERSVDPVDDPPGPLDQLAQQLPQESARWNAPEKFAPPCGVSCGAINTALTRARSWQAARPQSWPRSPVTGWRSPATIHHAACDAYRMPRQLGRRWARDGAALVVRLIGSAEVKRALAARWIAPNSASGEWAAEERGLVQRLQEHDGHASEKSRFVGAAFSAYLACMSVTGTESSTTSKRTSAQKNSPRPDRRFEMKSAVASSGTSSTHA